MTSPVQRNFAKGELSPAVQGRADTVAYATGLKTCRNGWVMKAGGWQNRPGTVFVCEVKDSTKAVRLVQFIFNADQTYILEFGDLYMRVIRNGAQVAETAVVITAVTQANPGIVTSALHGFSNGEEVGIAGILGMTTLNGRNFKVAGATANTFTLTYMDGSAVDTTAFDAYVSGGTASRIYTIVTPYAVADLPALRFAQSADVITIAHPTYAPRKLTRTAHTSWTLTVISFLPTLSQPNGGSLSSITGGATTVAYRVTAIDTDTGEESLPGFETTIAITGITQANPAVVTSAAHGKVNGDEVYITGVGGMTQVNGRRFVISSVAANTFQLVGTDSTAYTAYTAGGTAARTSIKNEAAAAATAADPHVISWTAVTGAGEYNVYKSASGVFGFLGVAVGTSFSDVGGAIDTADTPPSDPEVFASADNYPSTVGYYQQRLLYANTNDDPEEVRASKTGSFNNFTRRSPTQDDDSITWAMAGGQVNEVMHLLDLGKLIIMTSGNEWAALGDSAGTLLPTAVNQRRYTNYGASELQPIIIGADALFVQARASIVRNLTFNFEVDGYDGNDLTLFSTHLFEGKTLVDWTFQQTPNSICWAVRSDGQLLGLTYIKSQEILGWHHHDTDGNFENVCCIPEGLDDAVYTVVKRTINGTTKRYIERMHTRLVEDVVDCIMMDSVLSYDGRNTGATTMTLTGSGWTRNDTLTLTASAGTFTAADVGNSIFLTGSDGTVIRCSIKAYTSTTVVSVKPHMAVPVSMQNVATTTWSRAVDEVTGLWHLEGKDVSVFADGFVVASPNNPSYDGVIKTVTNGAISLSSGPERYAVVRVGLPYISDLETLDMDTPGNVTLMAKDKLIGEVSVKVEKTRGIFAGTKEPSDGRVGGLYEIKVRNDEALGEPVSLTTGVLKVGTEATWDLNGVIFIRQVDPIPVSILSVSPTGLASMGS